MPNKRWDPLEHKRGRGGRFVDMLKNLKPGSAVELPDGIKVRATTGRTTGGGSERQYEVQTPQGMQNVRARNADEAAKAALDASARNEHPNAVGGAKRYRDFDDAMGATPQAAELGHGTRREPGADLRALLPADPEKALRQLARDKAIPEFQKRAIRARLVAEQRAAKVRQPEATGSAQERLADAQRRMGLYGPTDARYKKAVADMRAAQAEAAGSAKFKVGDTLVAPNGFEYKVTSLNDGKVWGQRIIDGKAQGPADPLNPDVMKRKSADAPAATGGGGKPKAGDLSPGTEILVNGTPMIYMGRNATKHHVAKPKGAAEGAKPVIIRLKNVEMPGAGGGEPANADKGGPTATPKGSGGQQAEAGPSAAGQPVSKADLKPGVQIEQSGRKGTYMGKDAKGFHTAKFGDKLERIRLKNVTLAGGAGQKAEQEQRDIKHNSKPVKDMTDAELTEALNNFHPKTDEIRKEIERRQGQKGKGAKPAAGRVKPERLKEGHRLLRSGNPDTKIKSAIILPDGRVIRQEKVYEAVMDGRIRGGSRLVGTYWYEYPNQREADRGQNGARNQHFTKADAEAGNRTPHNQEKWDAARAQALVEHDGEFWEVHGDGKMRPVGQPDHPGVFRLDQLAKEGAKPAASDGAGDDLFTRKAGKDIKVGDEVMWGREGARGKVTRVERDQFGDYAITAEVDGQKRTTKLTPDNKLNVRTPGKAAEAKKPLSAREHVAKVIKEEGAAHEAAKEAEKGKGLRNMTDDELAALARATPVADNAKRQAIADEVKRRRGQPAGGQRRANEANGPDIKVVNPAKLDAAKGLVAGVSVRVYGKYDGEHLGFNAAGRHVIRFKMANGRVDTRTFSDQQVQKDVTRKAGGKLEADRFTAANQEAARGRRQARADAKLPNAIDINGATLDQLQRWEAEIAPLAGNRGAEKARDALRKVRSAIITRNGGKKPDNNPYMAANARELAAKAKAKQRADIAARNAKEADERKVAQKRARDADKAELEAAKANGWTGKDEYDLTNARKRMNNARGPGAAQAAQKRVRALEARRRELAQGGAGAAAGPTVQGVKLKAGLPDGMVRAMKEAKKADFPPPAGARAVFVDNQQHAGPGNEDPDYGIYVYVVLADGSVMTTESKNTWKVQTDVVAMLRNPGQYDRWPR